MTAKAAALLRANEKHGEHDSLFDDKGDKEKKVNGEEVTTVDAVVKMAQGLLSMWRSAD